MNGGGWWELCFSLLELEVTDKQGKKPRIMRNKVRLSDNSMNSCLHTYYTD